MTLEISGVLAIVSIIWNICLFIKTCILEDKVSYLKGQIETMKRSKENWYCADGERKEGR